MGYEKAEPGVGKQAAGAMPGTGQLVFSATTSRM